MKALRASQGLKASAYGAQGIQRQGVGVQGFRFLGHDQGFGGFRGDVGVTEGCIGFGVCGFGFRV